MSARLGVLAVGLGSAQLIAWGVLYYAIAVLAEPMRAELGLSKTEIFGTFTGALVIAGVLSPWAGRLLDRYGGRATLLASALIGAASFALLARSDSMLTLSIGWALAGAAMSIGLYEACFAAIGQLARDSYRIVVTSVTLLGGLASTVSWPLSKHLLGAMDWRGVCNVYALGLLVCAAIYLVVLPRRPSLPRAHGVEPVPRQVASDAAVHAAHGVQRRARLLAYAFAGVSLIGGAISAHIVGVLHALQLPGDRAIWIASAIGALQVFGRLADLAFGGRRSALQLGTLTFVALVVAMALLAASGSVPLLVYGFALLYGVANGLITIAKATLPTELLGFENVGALLGGFSAPSLVARALAPLLFAATLSAGGVSVALQAALAISVTSLVAYLVAARSPR